MDIVFAYLAGLLTLINPCVLPVLPIVLASALNADRRGPLALAAGMSLSFVTFGMVVATFGRAIGLTEQVLADTGAVAMLIFGAVLLVPALSSRFELAMAGLSSRADTTLATSTSSGLQGQFLGGLLLGAVWSPCIGPTLGGAIALASQGESLFWAFLIMVGFAAGVSTLILGIGLGGQQLIRRRTEALRGLAARSKPILGAVFIVVGLMILFRVNHVIDIWVLDNLPNWFNDLSIAI
ncbi:cytochrome c biogenesis protein CcdA [Litoreibacter ponti]|uniref:Cytochrome c biogenesis protein CcdA n=1 Tax=Litoreibacter ponti TaxID=1510457 RepID=A0A2T6BPP0_9RHOB|nr:cytochrome c biogenesis CcdA family protein [Litoreibacter ponti]PTX58041.1 cytochrome c biogenesis protein CcdA [Litoreibacter ponti]